jgi:hypothetical protein
MNDSEFSAAIGQTPIPHVDRGRLIAIYGEESGAKLAEDVLTLVRQANAMPIEWADMTLVQGVNDVMSRFRKLHPGLTWTRCVRSDDVSAGPGGDPRARHEVETNGGSSRLSAASTTWRPANAPHGLP